MQVAKMVKDRIKSERDAGKTYQAIADKYHVTQAYIIYLLNGKRDCSGITLGVFERMFPNATVDLDGRSIIASRVASPGDGNITYGDQSGALKAKIISNILDLDLPAETLKLVLQTVKNTEV